MRYHDTDAAPLIPRPFGRRAFFRRRRRSPASRWRARSPSGPLPPLALTPRPTKSNWTSSSEALRASIASPPTGQAEASGACASPRPRPDATPTRRSVATRRIPASTGAPARSTSPPTMARTRWRFTARRASLPTGGTSSTRTARLSSGWRTPGGWGSASGSNGPPTFSSSLPTAPRKGFTVVQIVAGLYPDMPAFDARGANEAGFPWEKDYARINPAYFDMADLRIQHLVSRGLVPCIVGCWGYFLQWMGVDENEAALALPGGALGRLSGGLVPGRRGHHALLSVHRPRNATRRNRSTAGPNSRATSARSIPITASITIHPSRSARECVKTPRCSTSTCSRPATATGRACPTPSARSPHPTRPSRGCRSSMARSATRAFMEASRQEVQRFFFWACVLERSRRPHLWRERHLAGEPARAALRCLRRTAAPGATSRGMRPRACPAPRTSRIPKALLMRYPWWRFEPHPEWVEPHWDEKNYWMPFAAGIPGEVRVIFMPTIWNPPQVKSLEPGPVARLLLRPSHGPRHPDSRDRAPMPPARGSRRSRRWLRIGFWCSSVPRAEIVKQHIVPCKCAC